MSYTIWKEGKEQHFVVHTCCKLYDSPDRHEAVAEHVSVPPFPGTPLVF